MTRRKSVDPQAMANNTGRTVIGIWEDFTTNRCSMEIHFPNNGLTLRQAQARKKALQRFADSLRARKRSAQ